jgi:hypothetical protein
MLAVAVEAGVQAAPQVGLAVLAAADPARTETHQQR